MLRDGYRLRRRISGWLVGLLTALILLAAAACSPPDPWGGDTERLRVVTSFSVAYDLVRNVAGDEANVYSVVEVGEDPHEYEPRPGDAVAIEGADLIFAIGLGLEIWFDNLVAAREGDGSIVRLGDDAVAGGLESIPVGWGAYEGEPDPHIWLDVRNTMLLVELIRDALSEADPDNAETYAAHAEIYLAELQQLHDWIIAQLAALPVAAEDRLLVTSEEAFRYFGQAYGFENRGIWPINAEHEGTPQQIAAVEDLVRARGVPAVFTETPVDPRPMELVSEATGVPLAGALYSDSIAEGDHAASSYIGMMRYNVELIVAAFTGGQ